MRVTERRMMEISATATARARDVASRAGRALSTGVAIEVASDDPVRWAQAKTAQARATVSGGHERSIAQARGRLVETDSVLDQIGEHLRRAQELAVQMGNGTLSASARASAAAEVSQLRQGVLTLANRRGGDGGYLLGGASGAAPFDAAGAWVGDAAVLTVASGEARTDAGAVTGEVLTAGAGVDVLAVLDDLAARMAADDQAGVVAQLDPLLTAIDQVASARTTTGVRMSALDAAEQARDELEYQLSVEIDRVAAADPVDAASRLARAAQALEAARAAGQAITQMLASG